MACTKSPWLVVLAAGEGKRLRPLTNALYSDQRPKPFATLEGRRSLLQATIDRFYGLVDEDRILVIAPAEHAHHAREQCAEWPAARIIAQPLNRGTAVGILLPLAAIRHSEPNAHVIVTPADHFVRDSSVMLEPVAAALGDLRIAPLNVVGVAARAPAPGFGWIVPGPRITREICGVERFVEKPDLDEATRLFASGALWSTFILLADAGVLWAHSAERLPDQAALLASATDLRSVYPELASADFSFDVLMRDSGFSCVAVRDCGWADFGTPEQVFEALTPGERAALLARLRERGADRDFAALAALAAA